MSISTQITVAATAETIIITAPGALRGPMGDVTPAAQILVERAETAAAQSQSSAGQAASSAAQAGDSASQAGNSASSAAQSAASASDSETAAGSSASSAQASASSATGSASSASSSAGAAQASAGEAQASASVAGQSATAAAQSATSAQEDADATAARVARFLAPSAVEPTQRDNGQPLQVGDQWPKTTDGKVYSWTGSAWSALDGGAQELETELSSFDGAKKVGGATVILQAIADLQLFRGRRDGDTAAINSLGSGWALNASYPFPSGGGEFVWDAASVEIPIYGMLAQVSGVATGRWKRKYSGPVHATWTGAIPDGLTKCSAAFQVAVDNYLAVYIPPGKFVLDRANFHGLIYNPAATVDCGVKITADQKCVELFGAGEATKLLPDPGVLYNCMISMYNVTDRSVHSFSMEGLYDRSGQSFVGVLSGIRQQSIRRCTTHGLKITNFKYHCLAMYGGSNSVTEPACLWNTGYNLYLDGGGQSSFILYSSTFTGLVLPNEFNTFTDMYAMNSHVYFGVEVRKSNNNNFVNLVTNSNMKGGLNLEEGASHNKFTNWVSKYNYYGLHITGNGVENVTGNRINNFDCSDNIAHNVLAFQGAVGNYFTSGRFNNAVNGNGWRSEDTTSFGNYFSHVECSNNDDEGFLFQNYEYLTDVLITGNTLRGLTVFGAAKLRRVVSRGNGTNIITLPGVFHDIQDCDFGPRHSILTKESIKTGQFIGVGQSSAYAGSGVFSTEIAETGSQSTLVWKNSIKDGKFIAIPTGFFAGSGFTNIKVSLRVKTDGPSRLLRDISGATNIPIPINTDWVWVSYTLPVSGLTSASVINIRYESASDVGFVLLDGYQLSLT